MSTPPKSQLPIAPIGKRLMLPVQQGDHLTRPEFERHHAAMPEHVRAELVEGRVLVRPDVRANLHAAPHGDIAAWVGNYKVATPGVRAYVGSHLRLDLDNMPRPDVAVCLPESVGGRSRLDTDGVLSGTPELVAEVAMSESSCELHDKLRAYRRNGVQEYLVWLTLEEEIRWFESVEGQFVPKPLPPEGVLKSAVFPGLWLDVQALLDGSLAHALAVLQTGLADPGHAALAESIKAASAGGDRK